MMQNMNNKMERGKLLAAVAVLAMLVCALAAILPADNVSAADESVALPAVGDDGAITIFEDGTYKLTADVTNNIVINSDVTATIDLAGYKISSSTTDTITNNGTLTIIDSSEAKNGTVDALAHQKAAILNNGTATLNGGTFIRSNENGMEIWDEDNQSYKDNFVDGTNTYYTIRNLGTMTINDGTTVKNAGQISSIIVNGLGNSTEGTLTINGGTIDGGKYIKNEYGTMTITGGTITGGKNAAVMSYGDLKISGGSFDTGSRGSLYLIGGSTDITGGSFATNVSDDEHADVTYKGTIYVVSEDTAVSATGISQFNKDSFLFIENAKVTVPTAKAIDVDGTVKQGENGSIEGDVSATLIDSTNNAIKQIKGAVTENTTVSEGAKLIDVTVNPGVKLIITKTASVEGDMRLYGTIEPATDDGAKLTVGKDATLTGYAGATVAKGVQVVSEDNGKIDLSAAMSTVTLNDDIESDFNATQSQKVVIADTLTIKSGYTMTILGELVINEGCTVIIEDGAKLILGNSTVKAAGMTVNGNIDVDQGGEIRVEKANDVTVVGEISSSGTVYINSNVTIKNGGIITIESYEDSKGVEQSEIEVVSGLTVGAGGELSVAGAMKIEDIKNKGTVTLNGAYVKTTSNIYLTANGAVFDVKSMTQAADATLYVRYTGMYLKSGEHSAVTFQAPGFDKVGIRNITITASLTSEEVDKDTTKYNNSLVLSGSPSILDDTEKGDYPGYYSIYTNARSNNSTYAGYTTESSIQVLDSLTLGKNVTLQHQDGNMYVDGTITATTVADVKGAAPVITTSGDGQIYVNGMITIDNENGMITSTGINAFFYEDSDNYYYTTLKTAVDNGAKDIEYFGNVTVLDTLTIPADTELDRGNNAPATSNITIGDGDNRDVIVTVADGATFRNCVINVMGTLVFENNKESNRNTNNITSDVIIDEEPKRTYTNIYTALEDAADGSTITIARNVYLDKDAEIRETITLEIPVSYGLYLNNEVTLTVNGTVENSGEMGNAVSGPAPGYEPDTSNSAGFNPYEADGTTVNEDRAEIVVNGTIMSMEYMDYNTYYIAGAYYQMVNDQGSWYYITPVDQAAAVSNDVENGKIEIFGTNTVGDITFTGDKTTPVTVTVTGTLNAGTVTLDRAGITVDGTFTGTAASSVGAVDAVNAKGFTVVDTYVDDTEKTYLTGNPVFADKDKDSSVTVATGTVNAGQIGIVTDDTKDAYIGSFAIAEGATLDVSGQYNRANASVDASKMTVDGTMNVANNGKVTITDALTVRGTFTVASADDNGNSAGIADIKKMYVGIAENKDKKFVDASAATVTSDETITHLETIYVSGESTITGDLTSNMQSTEFYVEDALWMTVYATSTAADKLEFVTVGIDSNHNPTYAYSFQPGDLDNSEFVYWADANGEQIIDGNAKVGDSDYQQVYANLNYDIYTITVFADPGIQAVYVDGKLMTSGTFQTGVDGMWAQGFRLSVAAGEHEITYKLGNYYSGEAKMTVNGTAVEGNTFTTSGTTTADKNVTIYLQGVQASGPETPSTTGGDDGMGLTDYLLIILVVLIVIMAIMVAMRLMRS